MKEKETQFSCQKTCLYLGNNATFLQLLDPLVAQTEPLFKDFVRVLAQQGWRRSDTGFRIRVLDGGVEDLDTAAGGVFDFLDHAAGDGCIASRTWSVLFLPRLYRSIMGGSLAR